MREWSEKEMEATHRPVIEPEIGVGFEWTSVGFEHDERNVQVLNKEKVER
jgi:hypothetical protein